jgi:hypothetical protein
LIPKRVSWFVVGAAAGAGDSLYARRKARQAVERMQPTNVAKVAVVKARGTGRSVVDAVREGRAAMKAKEAELRAADGRSATAAPPPTIVVIDAAAVLESDEFQPRRNGPRRRSRR